MGKERAKPEFGLRRGKTGPKPDREMDMRFIDWWNRGWSITEIADHTGRSKNAVGCRLRRLVREGRIDPVWTAAPAAVVEHSGVAARSFQGVSLA